jgi:putative tricarboxylic transport membrane protein
MGEALRANDVISGLVLIILSLAMIALTIHFPDFPGQKYGPALFPRILGVGVIICGLFIMWNGVQARRAGAPWVEIAPWIYEPWRVGSFLITLGMILLYILVSETVGFILIALVFLGGLFLWLGVRPVTAMLIAVVATVSIQYFFGTLLRVPLPRGWLTNIM